MFVSNYKFREGQLVCYSVAVLCWQCYVFSYAVLWHCFPFALIYCHPRFKYHFRKKASYKCLNKIHAHIVTVHSYGEKRRAGTFKHIAVWLWPLPLRGNLFRDVQLGCTMHPKVHRHIDVLCKALQHTNIIMVGILLTNKQQNRGQALACLYTKCIVVGKLLATGGQLDWPLLSRKYRFMASLTYGCPASVWRPPGRENHFFELFYSPHNYFLHLVIMS